MLLSDATNEEILISSEDEAFALFEKALAHELGEKAIRLRFSEWPRLTFSLEGEGYDSTITPAIAEAIVELQHALNRAYARAIHGTTNARTLTADERRHLQFKAKVEKGSSLINIDLGPYAKELAGAIMNVMGPEHVVITVLGSALIAGGTVVARAFLKHRSEDHEIDAATRERVALSQEETRRAQILADAMSSRPLLLHASQDFDDVRKGMLKAATDAEKVTFQGVELTGADARQISSTPRSGSEEVRLDGHYVIQKIDWTHDDEVRIWLASTDTELKFMASFKGQGLDQEHKNRLREAEWDRKKVHMRINGTRLRGEVTTASILEVDWPKPTSDEQATA